ncbi:ribonucleotide monophosphatase NagD [alpha proteobacterium Q-1]|nr:ribonucleotide monophosphatase NagD [alpha proteobacterium Q-1]
MSVPVLPGLSALVADHPYIICDIWGVLHDGEVAFPLAVDALCRARAAGAMVVLVTNSPRPAQRVAAQLSAFGIDQTAYDGLITSGELTRHHLQAHFTGQRFFHIGPDEDRDTLAGLDLVEGADSDDADVLVATGLFGPDLDAHAALIAPAARKGVPMLCANPDRVVRDGGKIFICAGAVADVYEDMGGAVRWLGKPAPPPYEACHKIFSAKAGQSVTPDQQLIIGDGLATDITGALGQSIKAILIESGIHHDDLRAHGLDHLIGQHRAAPDYRMHSLAWQDQG